MARAWCSGSALVGMMRTLWSGAFGLTPYSLVVLVSAQSGKGRSATPDDDDDEEEEPRGKGFLAPPPLEANPNRMQADVEVASGIDEALDLLGGQSHAVCSAGMPWRHQLGLYFAALV